MTDKEIIDQILKGDRNLYREIVNRYQTMVFRICIGFLHNKDDADDLTQDVFIQAYTSLSGFKGNSSFSTWLYRIAVNACLNRKRQAVRKMVRLDDSLPGEKKDMGISVPVFDQPDNQLIHKEQKEIFQKALNGLKENQHIAFVLSKYDDLSQKEIASVMNISEGSVEALLHRAKVSLRESLFYFYKKLKNE